MGIFQAINNLKERLYNIYDMLLTKDAILPEELNSNTFVEALKSINSIDEWVKPDDWPDLREIYKEEIPEKYKNAGAKYKVCLLLNTNKPIISSKLQNEFRYSKTINDEDIIGFQIKYFDKNRNEKIYFQDAYVLGGTNSITIPNDMVDYWTITLYTKTIYSISDLYPNGTDIGRESYHLMWWYSPDTYRSAYNSRSGGERALERVDAIGPVYSDITPTPYMFTRNQSITSINFKPYGAIHTLSTWNNIINFTDFFTQSLTIKRIDLRKFLPKKGIKCTTAMNLFYQCYCLEQIIGLEDLDFSECTSFDRTWYNCACLEEIDLSFITTNKITTLANTFNGCMLIKKINLTGMNLSLVTQLVNSFSQNRFLKEIDLSGNLKNVVNCSGAFNQCLQLEKINLVNSDLSKVTNFSSTFTYCASLQHIICPTDNTTGPRVSFSLAHSTILTHESLINILTWLGDMTGQTAQTLTLGEKNLAKLTEEERQIATNKNWILA